MEGNGYFAARVVDPVSDLRVVFVDSEAGGKEDGEGENEAWAGQRLADIHLKY